MLAIYANLVIQLAKLVFQQQQDAQLALQDSSTSVVNAIFVLKTVTNVQMHQLAQFATKDLQLVHLIYAEDAL